MTITKTDGVWAESGDVTPAPTDAKKAIGFLGGDQPTIETFNYLVKRLDDKVDEIIEERVNSFYEDAADPQSMISTGLWDESWGIPSDTLNMIDSGVATSEYRDLAVIFNSDNQPRLLVLDNALTKIEVWNPRTLTLVDTSDDLTDDLPASGAVWVCESMCTDGTSVYVTLKDTNASPDTHIIQAWDIATWDVKSGWAATGTALQGTGNTSGNTRESKVIIANATTLAVVCCYQAISADTDPAIQLFSITAGAAGLDGAGDAPTGTSATALDTICSDGTNIFFATYGTNVQSICSATISDPTAGCGGTNFAGGFSLGDSDKSCMIQCGPDLIVDCIYPISTVTSSDIILRTFNDSDADLEAIEVGQNSQSTPVVGNQYLLGHPIANCFDGVNVWVFGYIEFGGNDGCALIKIDTSKLANVDRTTRQLPDIANGPFLVDVVNFPSGASNWIYQSCKFDGRDIWVNTEQRASQTNSGKIHRLPLALLRH